jgi:ArsR family transcriptional regulator
MNARRKAAEKTGVDAAGIARVCHALSDETRLAVLDRLRGGEECVCNLTDLLATGQSRLSFHMKVLKDAGLVRDRRAGRWIHYSLKPGALDVVRDFIASLSSRRTP